MDRAEKGNGLFCESYQEGWSWGMYCLISLVICSTIILACVAIYATIRTSLYSFTSLTDGELESWRVEANSLNSHPSTFSNRDVEGKAKLCYSKYSSRS